MNPFDDPKASFCVLVNAQGQHSLWPRHIKVPAGWEMVGPQGDREECLRWIDANWTDVGAA
ncbi:MbtH family protein [Bradyrhizobium sp. ORS 375]|uniref:MbtH family protein n=1 Tax=Bradyrhizobium sp. (strain ORS 375) TaxID=566679 RepID=UPI000A058B67|nr:MbtH family protein [Bradyrhizobium sp. ORS 375]